MGEPIIGCRPSLKRPSIFDHRPSPGVHVHVVDFAHSKKRAGKSNNHKGNYQLLPVIACSSPPVCSPEGPALACFLRGHCVSERAIMPAKHARDRSPARGLILARINGTPPEQKPPFSPMERISRMHPWEKIIDDGRRSVVDGLSRLYIPLTSVRGAPNLSSHSFDKV
jgi:hypothetical protein